MNKNNVLWIFALLMLAFGMSSCINANHWTAGSYAVSFVGKGKESGRDYDYGMITLRDGAVTEIGDPEPLSEQFLRIFRASQFILYGNGYLYLIISPKEYFAFRNEAAPTALKRRFL